MANVVLQDRVREASSTSGTSDISLGGAYVGYRTFASCVPDNSVVYYCIQNTTAGYDNEWEVGYGTYDLGTNKLLRNTGDPATSGVYSSSNSNTWVSFSSPAALDVFITQPSEQAVYQEVDGSLKLIGGIIEVSLDGSESVSPLPNVAFQAFSTINSYMQTNMQNLANASQSSADYVCTADYPFGTDTDNYVDLGFASSGYNYPDFAGNPPLSGYIQCTADNGIVIQSGKFGANVAAANASATDIIFSAGDLLTSGYRGYIKGDTGNWILGPYGSTDTGEKLQVTGNTKITANVAVGGNLTITGGAYSGVPVTAGNQLANKAYVDSVAATGLDIHESVQADADGNLDATYTDGGTTQTWNTITGNNTIVASAAHSLASNDVISFTTNAASGNLTANVAYFVSTVVNATAITLASSYGGVEITTLTNGTSLGIAGAANTGVGATLEANSVGALELEGYAVQNGDRVILIGQTNPEENGVYVQTVLGDLSTAWKLERSADTNTYSPGSTGLDAGSYFLVTQGTDAGESYVNNNDTPIIFGYTPITFAQFSRPTVYNGVAPINVTDLDISLGLVPTNLGGTNLTSYAAGDIIYASATDVLSKRTVGNSGAALIVSGGFPAWGTIDLASSNAVSSTLGATNGGTGQSTYVLGDLLYSSATNTLAKLPGQTTTTKKYLQQQGDGVNSAAPSWQQIAAGDISGLAPSATTDTTNATNITSGTLATGRLSGSYTGITGVGNLTAGTWSANVVTTTYGGTGTAGTLSGLAYGNGASAMTAASAAQVVAVIGSTAVANATYAVSANSATYTSNILGGLAGGIPYQTGANATTILAAGTGVLVAGATPSYSTTPTLTGTNFSGIPNSATTATAANTLSAIVARDASGNFAAGTITANLTGTASSATTAVNVAAANLTGSTLSSNVTSSSLTGLGTVGTGTWQANTVTASYGGTGVAGTLTGISYMNGTSAHTAATAAQVVAVIGSTAVANATYAVSAGSATTATSATTAATATNVAAANLTGTTLSSNVTSSSLTSVGSLGNTQIASLGVGTAASGTSGEIRATNNVTAYYSSDIKFKENVQPIQNALSTVIAIGGKTFDWKDEYVEARGGEDGYFIQKSDFGVIAQDVQKAFPIAVRTRPDGSLAVDYEKLSALAFAAIVELKAEIEALKTGA